MKKAISILTLALFLTGVAVPAMGDVAEWRRQERECIKRCPKKKTFGGIETVEAWRERIKADIANDSCYRKCNKQFHDHFDARRFWPSKSAQRYYNINKGRIYKR